MRDLSQIERELREYERKIQRLKQLERELNSLDTKGFENEVRSIKSKIKDPDVVNQVEREISKLKQKIEVKERRTKEAVKAIDTAKSTLQKAKGFDLGVSDAERLLNEAKSLLGKGDYITAIQSANKSKGIAETEIDKKFKQSREETLNAISRAQSTLQNVKKFGINTKSEEEKLNNAKLKLDEKDFLNATKLANQCKNSLEQKINEYKKAAERSAKQSLDFAYSKMKEGEKLGINVSDAQDLHRKAISKFDRREYEKAIDYSENCKKAAEDEISRYNHAKEQIRASKDIVENVKRVVSIPKVIDLIKNAEAALEIGNYNSAFKLAKQAEGEALKFKQDYERYKETSEFVSSIESEISRIKSSGVKIPKSPELIKQAKSELNKNNFERAKELAEEAKKIASERKSGYNLAFKSISESERILNETKNKGVIISSNLLTKSKHAFDNGDYEESVKSAEELKNLVNNREIKYRDAREWIKSAESAIERAREFGCKVSEAENLLNKADSAFNNGNYTDATGYAKQAEETAKRTREESKPEITIKLSETSFKTNAWKRIDLIFKNNGTATAKVINVEYPKERIEIEDLTEIKELNPKEEKKLRIGLRSIHTGEVPLKTKIRYKDLDNKEYKEEKTFWITVGEEEPLPPEGLKPDIKRETEFFNGFIRLKMAVTNPMSQIITDVSLDLDFDENTLRLDRHEPESYSVKKGKVQLGTITPGTGKTLAFYLDPMTCTKAGTDINCRVDYRDAYGKSDSIRMESKKVEVVCPIFSTESDINIGMLKEFIETLPYHDNKIYQIPPGLETDKLIETCRETIQMHDVRHIRTLRTKDGKTCETWYYGKTKVDKSNIVIKASINEETGSIELFAATPAPESLTGLLAELGQNLTKKIRESGKKPEQVVNVSIKDTIIQRSPNLLNLCDMNGVCSEENIIVEDSFIPRSRIGGV